MSFPDTVGLAFMLSLMVGLIMRALVVPFRAALRRFRRV